MLTRADRKSAPLHTCDGTALHTACTQRARGAVRGGTWCVAWASARVHGVRDRLTVVRACHGVRDIHSLERRTRQRGAVFIDVKPRLLPREVIKVEPE